MAPKEDGASKVSRDARHILSDGGAFSAVVSLPVDRSERTCRNLSLPTMRHALMRHPVNVG